MRRCLYCLICLFVAASCSKKTSRPLAAEEIVESPNDSSESEQPESVDTVESVTEVPKAADEYFNDFIYSFTNNKAYQMSRIVFPLLCVRNGKTTYLQKKQWRFSRFHMKYPVYTLFFDKRSSLNLEKSKEITEVKMEQFNMLTGEVRTYGFNKIAGQWKMTRIEDNPLSKYGDCAFIDFYQQFATDSAFQMAHVKPMLSILMESPEDEFEKIDGVIEAEQWPSFCPELPADVFTNIDYGQSMSLGNRRIVVLEGTSNGYISMLFFVKEDGEWMLQRFEN
ncbi:MAG TPA: hypothetical protein DEQ84_04900 [Prevotellaceae bacterium]|nr:hypothetical protein [Prevotellaceae bacterium]